MTDGGLTYKKIKDPKNLKWTSVLQKKMRLSKRTKALRPICKDSYLCKLLKH